MSAHRRLDVHRFTAFGGARCEILACDVAPAHVSACVAEVYAFEARLSRFREDSELSAFNAAAGARCAVSPVLEELLRTALDASARTDGLVNAAVLPALVAAGYDRSIEQVRRRDAAMSPLAHAARTGAGSPVRTGSTPAQAADSTPAPAAPSTLAAPASFTPTLPYSVPPLPYDHSTPAAPALFTPPTLSHSVPPLPEVLQVGHGWAQLAPGCAVDLGGVGKGWLADRLAERLGDAVVNLGGDLRASGGGPDGEGWTVGLCDGTCLRLRDGGVATSGVEGRHWRGGHHLVDPRTGRPATTDIAAVSVVAADAETAEALAKAAAMLGSAAAPRWLRDHGAARWTVRRSDVELEPAVA